MPWNPEDASKHTHLANTPARQRQWAHVANGILARTGDDARAVIEANGVLEKHPSMKKDEPAARKAEPSKPPQRRNVHGGGPFGGAITRWNGR